MGVQYRKSAQVGKNSRINVSQRGVSLSQRSGPVTMSTRGRASVRLAPGWSFRVGKNATGWLALVMLAVSVVALFAWMAWMAVKLMWLAFWIPSRWLFGFAQQQWAARRAENA